MIGSTIKVTATAESGNTFESEETAEVGEALINVVGLDQLKADTLAITFDQDASDLTADDITIERVDGEGKAVIKSIADVSDDGTTVTVVMNNPFVDGVAYDVYADGEDMTFTASVGEVAYMVIATTSAEVNIKTPIDVLFYDENGTDVTSKVQVATAIDMTMEGVDGAVITADPANRAITMNEVDDEAEVTVTYKLDENVETVTGIITCTDAEATIGTAHVRSVTVADPVAESSSVKVWSDGSYCARFETGSDVDKITVGVGGTKDGVFFTAEDKTEAGKYISYDSYEVSSSDDNVAIADIEDGIDSGKYARISVSGIATGSANILINAVKNGVGYTYQIPVVVVDEVKLVSITAKASRPTMTNAIDNEYYGTITVTGKWSDSTTSKVAAFPSKVTYSDPDETKHSTQYSANLIKALGGTNVATEADLTGRGAQGFEVDDEDYYAWGSKAGSYQIDVATDDGYGKPITTAVKIKVEDLPESAWDLTGDGTKITYKVDFTSSDGGEGNALDYTSTTTTKGKLAAYAGTLFAGYVRTNAITGLTEIGNQNTVAVELQQPEATIKVGTKYFVIKVADVAADEIELSEKAVVVNKVNDLGVGAVAYDGAALTIAVNTDGLKTAAKKEEGTITITGTPSALAEGSTASTIVVANVATAPVIYTIPNGKTNAEIATALAGAINGAAGALYEAATDTTTANQINLKAKSAGAVTTAPTSTFTANDGTGVTAAAWAETTQGADAVYIAATDLEAALQTDGWGNNAEHAVTEANLSVTEAAAGTKDSDVTNAFSRYVPAGVSAENVRANKTSTIYDIYAAVKYGNSYGISGELYDAAANISTPKSGITFATAHAGAIELNTVNGNPAGDEGLPMYKQKDTRYDYDFAVPSTYIATFWYTQNKKTETAVQNVSVSNTLSGPNVKVLNYTLDALDTSELQENIRISCDATCNLSEADSLNVDGTTTYKNSDTKGNITPTSEENGKWTVTYVSVIDNGINYIVPINATFKTE